MAEHADAVAAAKEPEHERCMRWILSDDAACCSIAPKPSPAISCRSTSPRVSGAAHTLNHINLEAEGDQHSAVGSRFDKMTMLARRPYNVYNIFFILERAKIAQAHEQQKKKGGKTRTVAAAIREKQLASASSSAPGDLGGFDLVHLLPEFPPRYHDLKMPPDWYVPMGKANRKHVATNGCE